MTAPKAGHDDDAIMWCLRLHEGPLPASDLKALRSWLAGDPAREERLDAALGVWHSIAIDADAPEMLSLRREALGAVQIASRKRWQSAYRPSRFTMAAIAAVLLLAVSLGAFLWNGSGVEHYRTANGERRVVTLDDGSRLSLDADSSVRVAFTGTRRSLVLERGRARFKVAKDPLRPFAVRSGRNLVVATGTEFSVERLAGEVRVALMEGHVAVLRDASNGRENEMVRQGPRMVVAERALVPGRELRLPLTGAVGVIRPTPAAEGWESGQVSFAQETLAIAAERMNRYAGTRRIDVAPEVAGMRVSGVFDAGDVDAFAQAIAAAFPVNVSFTGNILLMKPRDGDTVRKRDVQTT